MYAIIVSKQDPAGMNIRKALLAGGRFKTTKEEFEGSEIYAFKDARLYTISDLHIHSEALDTRITADAFIFATTHKSEKGVHSLSLHYPGNFGDAKLGGKPRELVPSHPRLLSKLFRTLKKEAEGMQYELTMEVTHHGPYLITPSVFIEIGSGEEQWRDPEAGEVIARTIERVIDEGLAAATESAIAIGGTHYCARFNKLVLSGEHLIGHVCPKYALENLDETMLRQMMARSELPASYALLDWKGMGKEKARIVSVLEEMKIKIEKV